jgi:hypothetical protein
MIRIKFFSTAGNRISVVQPDCADAQSDLQGDSFRKGPDFIIINRAVIYRWKQELESTQLGICGDNWVTDDTGTGFPHLGDTDRHDAPMLANTAASVAGAIIE